MVDDLYAHAEVPESPQIPHTRRPTVYVAATRQHVGKTTTSLALLSGLQKRVGKMGFVKPVGQHSLKVKEDDGQEVACDKDAVLVRQHFGLTHLKYQHMSPVLIPKGYTKDYVDGKITQHEQRRKLEHAFHQVSLLCDAVLCEGTGHTAVGSIVDASNAQVASWLGAHMVLVANGGLGNALDELDLNKVFCDKYGVEIAGVIINKVLPNKYEQTQYYLERAIREKWGNVPLLGVIPDRPFLGCPALADLERLLKGSTLVSGRDHLLRHYTVQDINLVASSLEVFLRNIRTTDPSRTLYVSHASRHDILLGFFMEAQTRREDWQAALVLTGCEDSPPSQHILEILKQGHRGPPVLLAPQSTAEVMEAMHHYTPKLNFEDGRRVQTAIQHYEDYINFDLLLERLGEGLSPSESPLSSSS